MPSKNDQSKKRRARAKKAKQREKRKQVPREEQATAGANPTQTFIAESEVSPTNLNPPADINDHQHPFSALPAKDQRNEVDKTAKPDGTPDDSLDDDCSLVEALDDSDHEEKGDSSDDDGERVLMRRDIPN